MNMQRYLVLALLAVTALVGYFAYSAETARKAVLARIDELEAQKPAATPALPAPTAVPTPTEKTTVVTKAGVDLTPYLRKIDELRAGLEASQKELDSARATIENQQGKLATQAESLKSLEASVASTQEAAAKESRIVEALQAELKVKSQRMIQAEQAEKVLQERLLKAEQSARRATASTKELDDIQRRRENAYTSLERRVREVGDIIRGFTLNAQTRETGTLGLAAGDLSRLQTALQQADEDLRQIRSLNARASDLAKAK